MKCGRRSRAAFSLLGMVIVSVGVALRQFPESLSSQHLKNSATIDEVAVVAAQVRRQAQRTEKDEGRHDLIKDSVKTKTTASGQKIIEEFGEASFYGKGFRGKKMASGKRFNQRALTAAHPTLPLGTKAKVTNLETGAAVRVQITDRGPYAKGRNLDLSKAAAQKIGLTNEGEVPVKIEATIPAVARPRTGVTVVAQEARRTKKHRQEEKRTTG